MITLNYNKDLFYTTYKYENDKIYLKHNFLKQDVNRFLKQKNFNDKKACFDFLLNNQKIINDTTKVLKNWNEKEKNSFEKITYERFLFLKLAKQKIMVSQILKHHYKFKKHENNKKDFVVNEIFESIEKRGVYFAK